MIIIISISTISYTTIITAAIIYKNINITISISTIIYKMCVRVTMMAVSVLWVCLRWCTLLSWVHTINNLLFLFLLPLWFFL